MGVWVRVECLGLKAVRGLRGKGFGIRFSGSVLILVILQGLGTRFRMSIGLKCCAFTVAFLKNQELNLGTLKP